MAGKYLDWYVADLAWREDSRRTDFRTQAKRLLCRVLGVPTSRNMAGYWQRPGKRDQPLVGWNPISGMGATPVR